jgi:transposase
LWFEGAGGESLGRRGDSKDYRGHLKQVVLGIVLDDGDRPIASFLMPGNTADVTLLLPVVKRRRERFGIAGACIVADRGMISADTIAALEAEKIEYILGVCERTNRDKALVANKGFRRLLKTPEGDRFVIDRAKVEADARFDGLFVLRTNTKIAALQVVLRYRNLLAVEDAFRTAKALLATRPIFHKTDAGIRGHVFCNFLALILRKELMDRLAARRSTLEWQRVIEDLADLSEIDVKQDGRRARLRTAPGPTIDAICRAIAVTPPPVFQEMPVAP